ncbi:MAG: DTW domain-containing protein YfiP [Alteromonadaceae bacterium]|jgi:DTW domain-containing protein YfiP
MARDYCGECQRPLPTCICTFISNIDNDIHVIVLQHPLEVKQAKGTVTMLAKSLNKCSVFIGEDFTENIELHQLLNLYQQHTFLLYPSEQANVIGTYNKGNEQGKCLILLDGTWKKAYRMFMLNTFLHEFPHLSLPLGIEGGYQIRKTTKNGALSSLEACSHALMLLEGTSGKYQKLLNNFVKFNEFQLSFSQKKNQ